MLEQSAIKSYIWFKNIRAPLTSRQYSFNMCDKNLACFCEDSSMVKCHYYFLFFFSLLLHQTCPQLLASIVFLKIHDTDVHVFCWFSESKIVWCGGDWSTFKDLGKLHSSRHTAFPGAKCPSAWESSGQEIAMCQV